MVWEHCKPEAVLNSEANDELSKQVPELDCDEGSEDESKREKADRCNLKPFQNYCRNTLLKYFAFEKNNEVVYKALQESKKFRREFHDQCRLTSKSIPNAAFYEPIMGKKRDELLDSLQGLDEVEESSEDSELQQLKVK